MRLDGCAWSGLALVLVVAAGCREAGEPPPPGPVVAGLANRCPAPTTPIPYPPGGRLPDGAVGVRLCNTPEDFNDNNFQPGVDVPADELTTDVEDLVDLVNAADAVPHEQDCTFEAGPDLAFWFRYPDGTARAVRYERYGCRIFLVGGDRERLGGEHLHAAFSDRLLAQREGRQPPGSSPPPDCSDQHGPPTDPALEVVPGVDLERAVLCVIVRGGFWRQVPDLTRRQVERIDGDFQFSSRSKRRCHPKVFVRIIAVTAWGDLIDLAGECWSLQVPVIRGHSGSVYETYRPSPGVQRMLQRVIDGDHR